MSRSHKPSVFQVGKVRDDGHTVVISGWGLGLCAGRAPATGTRPPATSRSTRTRPVAGSAWSAIADGGCDCCEAWTADELSAILRDFQTIAGLEAQEPLAG